MYSIRSTILTAALSALLLAAGHASAATKQQTDEATAKLAAAASPMSTDALEKLYAGRTWQWGKNGAGFFSAKKNTQGLSGGKRFIAETRHGRARGYGQGDWYVTRGGKLCMRALWSDKNSGNNGAITCFLHREKDGVIYQKRNLGGQWYVFRHNPVRKNDEARKLVKGDRVSKEVSQLKATRR
jgi:uncharacterized protein DUF995